mgnify:CR=1 FL=1
MRELQSARLLEAGHAHAARIHPLEDMAHHAVFAAGVHRLQHDQDPMLPLGVEQLLQRFELAVQLERTGFARLATRRMTIPIWSNCDDTS